MTRFESGSTRQLQVLIVDDHDLVREGLKRVVEDEPDISVAAEAENFEQAMSALRRQAIDAVLVDINLPDINGIDLLKAIKREWPRIPVLILTAAPEEHYAVWAIKSGASGYLSKDHAVERLALAIRKVAAGGRYITASVAERLAEQIDMLQPSALPALSQRELDVLRLIAVGRSTSQIALALQLSDKTVGTYRTRIQQETGVRTNAELARYALDHKLVS